MAVKTGKAKLKKDVSKESKKSKNTKMVEQDVRGIDYKYDLKECIQRGYSGVSAKKGTKEYDDQRLEVRENCRTSKKKNKKK